MQIGGFSSAVAAKTSITQRSSLNKRLPKVIITYESRHSAKQSWLHHHNCRECYSAHKERKNEGSDGSQRSYATFRVREWEMLAADLCSHWHFHRAFQPVWLFLAFDMIRTWRNEANLTINHFLAMCPECTDLLPSVSTTSLRATWETDLHPSCCR